MAAQWSKSSRLSRPASGLSFFSTSTFPAKHWLETYRVSFGQMAKKAKVHGGDAVLQELEKLSANDPISLFAYDANGQLGLFWMTEDNRLVGFAIVVPKK